MDLIGMDIQLPVSQPIDAVSYKAPAKLNLFLHVVGRRADGYHLLESVFQLVDLCDEIRVFGAKDGQIRRPVGAWGVAEANDLVTKAALLLKTTVHDNSLGARIEVVKRIPMGAGLGGGSSDAACTLIALNQLWGLNFSVNELAALGLKLGADVPFFVHGQTAWVEGIGEILRPVTTPKLWFALIYPGVAVSTPKIFQSPELTRNSRKLTIGGSLTWDSSIGFVGRNDLQAVAITLEPAIGEALNRLTAFAPARMTGSGACVFAAFSDPLKAKAAVDAVLSEAPQSWRGWVVRSVDRTIRLNCDGV